MLAIVLTGSSSASRTCGARWQAGLTNSRAHAGAAALTFGDFLGVLDADRAHRRVRAQFFPRERSTLLNRRAARFRKERLPMFSKKRLAQYAAVPMAASILLLATAAFAGEPQKSAKTSSQSQTTNTSDQIQLDNAFNGGRCAVAASTTPQGTQQVHVCNNWTGAPGAQVEMFNTTGQSCTITTGTTQWPFVQSAPLTVADGAGLWVTLLTSLTTGGTQYNYNVSCCAVYPMPKVVTVP
jgi:hypothetical protein